MSDDILIGRGWGFPVGVDATGGIRMAGGHVEIEEAASLRIGAGPGERVLGRACGGRIHELVCAPNNAETLGIARRHVEEALGMWEPRIEVESVHVTADTLEADRGRLNIEVTYTVRGTKDARSLVYPFYLIEHE